MKKVFLALAIMALVTVSCKKVEAPARLTTVDSTTVDSTTVKVDSVSVDTTAVDTIAVK
jgi:hypothetical protein